MSERPAADTTSEARTVGEVYIINPDTKLPIDPRDSGGGGGAGTEYTQDAVAPTNPVAPALQLRRTDTLASVGADGDWVTARGTSKGEVHVKAADTDARLGEVQATPTANTVLGRLKDLITGIVLAAGTNIIGKVGIDQTTDGTTNKVVPSGNVAHAAVDAGNPLKVGGRAYSGAPGAVADGNRVDQAMTLRGAAHTVLARTDGTIVDPDAPATVIGLGDKIQVAPTVTSGAYSANDVIGGKLTFASANRTSGGAGWVQSVCIASKAAVTPQLELWLFDADPSSTSIADNGAWSLNVADLGKVIDVVPVASADWKDGGTPNFVRSERRARYELGATSMYGYLVDRTGTTLTSTSDIIVTLELVFD